MAQTIITLKQIGTGNDIDKGENQIISYVEKVAPLVGVNDGVAPNGLIDSATDFVAAGVQVGDVVTNTTTNKSASVLVVTAFSLGLDADIFLNPGEGYEVGGEYSLECDQEGVLNRFLTVGDAIAKVVNDGTIFFTTTSGSETVLVNAERVAFVTEDGSGSIIHYRANDIDLRQVSSDDSKATVIGLINAIP